MRARWAAGILAGAALLATACGGGDDEPTGASPSLDAGPETASYDVNGHSLEMTCEGSGSPTVVMVSGLDSDRHTWDPLAPDLAQHARVCSYDRAGTGASEPSDDETPTAGETAVELAALLEAAGVEAPYVLVGHSYGGMVARLFTAQHPDDVAGLVLVDSAVEGEFTDAAFAGIGWVEADTDIDTAATGAQLQAARDLGSTPLVVLTAGRVDPAYKRLWYGWQDDLAAMSSDSVHVVAPASDHFIQENQPELIVAAVADLVGAAAAGDGLPLCGDSYTSAGGTCR